MNFNSFDLLAFVTGTGAATASNGQLINSAVLVAFIVLITKIVEWRIKATARRKQTAFEAEIKALRKEVADGLGEQNALLRRLAHAEDENANQPSPSPDSNNSHHVQTQSPE